MLQLAVHDAVQHRAGHGDPLPGRGDAKERPRLCAGPGQAAQDTILFRNLLLERPASIREGDKVHCQPARQALQALFLLGQWVLLLEVRGHVMVGGGEVLAIDHILHEVPDECFVLFSRHSGPSNIRIAPA